MCRMSAAATLASWNEPTSYPPQANMELENIANTKYVTICKKDFYATCALGPSCGTLVLAVLVQGTFYTVEMHSCCSACHLGATFLDLD